MEENNCFFYNDEPIQNCNEDSLSRTDFVNNLADSILSYNDKNGLVIGLHGKWGSGKTSIINLLMKKIEDIQKNCKIINKHKILFFNPWNFTEQNQLISIFFKEIVSQLRTIYFNLGKKQIQIRNKEINNNDIRTYCKLFGSIVESLQYIPIISPIARSIASPIKKMGEVLSNEKNESLEKSKRRLEKKLSKIKYKIVIIIDDIDRLNDKEIIQMFQLIKLISDLPNIIILCAYDKEIIVKALSGIQKGYADIYLDKIINIPIRVPLPLENDLELILGKYLDSIIKEQEIDNIRLNHLKNTGIFGKFKTIRDIKRFCSVFSFKYNPICCDIDFLDLFVFNFLEQYYNEIYNEIYSLKEIICGYSSDYKEEKKEIELLVESLIKDNKEKDFIKALLRFIFPKIDSIFSGLFSIHSKNFEKADFKNRAFINTKLPFYYNLSIKTIGISKKEMLNVLEIHIKEVFLEAVKRYDKEKKLNIFLYFIKNHITSNDNSNLEYIYWFLDYAPNIISNRDWMSPSYTFSSMVEDILKEFSLEERFKILKNIFNNYEISESINLIYYYYANEQGKCKENAISNPQLTSNQLNDLENILCPKLLDYIDNNIEKGLFVSCFWTIYHINKSRLKEWIDNKAKNDNELLIKIILPLCLEGSSTEFNSNITTKTYAYSIDDMEKIFDIRKCNDIIIDKVLSNINIDDKNHIILTSFIMSNDRKKTTGSSFGCGFTKNEIITYLIDNNYIIASVRKKQDNRLWF